MIYPTKLQKNLYYSFLFIVYWIILFVSTIQAVVVEVPPAWGSNDVVVSGPTRVVADESTVFSFIQFINQYLWLALGVVALGVLVYGGFKLISSQGDGSAFDKARDLIIWTVIGIVIVILSYAIVRLVINLL
jgi:hypothetical protein